VLAGGTLRGVRWRHARRIRRNGGAPAVVVKSPRGDGLVEVASVVVALAMTTLVWMRLFGAW
jgi:hypothetical protein